MDDTYTPSRPTALSLWERIWNGILTDLTSTIPQVPTLIEANLSQLDLAYALRLASAWLSFHLQYVNDSTAFGIFAKWFYVHHDETLQSTADLPVWALRYMLVDCWMDVRMIRQMGLVPEE